MTVLAAALPIAVVLVLMVVRGWPGGQAGAVGWLTALITAAVLFGAGADVLLVSQGKALLLSVYVLYIIWAAVALYHVVAKAGALEAIAAGVARVTQDPLLQLLLLAWAFASFLQGVTGFGVPVAVVAPLLVALGFAPVSAVVAASIGHSWAVTFGSVASSFYAMLAVTGLPVESIAWQSALLLGLAAPLCGLCAAVAAGPMPATSVALGRGTLARSVAPILLAGAAMAGAHYLIATTGAWQLASFGAGLIGIAVLVGYARLQPRPARRADGPQGQPEQGTDGPDERPMQGLPLPIAVSAYAILLAVVAFGTLVPGIAAALDSVQVGWRFPATVTRLGYEIPAEPGRDISLFGHAGALILYAAVLAFLLYRAAGAYGRQSLPGPQQRHGSSLALIARDTYRDASRPSASIVALVGMALLMSQSGMTAVLAQAMATASGQAFPLVSPFIGALGAFMTGSNTNSNVLFAPLQMETGAMLGLEVAWLLAAQNLGGAIGSAFAPAKVIVACSTVGLVGAAEAEVLRRNLVWGLAIIAVGALVVAALLAG